MSWKNEAEVCRLLESARELMPELRDVVVVENGASRKPESTPAPFPGVQYVRLPENRGFAAAANVGIGRVASAFVLLLNPDVLLEPDAVRRLYRELLTRSDVAVGAPLLRSWDGTSQAAFQVRPLPTLGSVIRDALFLDELASWFGRRPQGDPRLEGGGAAIEVEQPAAAFWLLRKDAWAAIGGFDPRFVPAWFEDVDFCKRLRERGWKLLLFPGLSARHEGGCSLPSLGYARFLRIYYGNLLRYWRKHHVASLWLVWPAVRLGLLLRRVAHNV